MSKARSTFVNCPICARWAPYGICPDHGVIQAPEEVALAEGFKECSKCGLRKPLESFSKNSRTLDGHQGQCKSCRAAYDKSWANRPVVREANLRNMRDTNNARYANDPAFREMTLARKRKQNPEAAK